MRFNLHLTDNTEHKTGFCKDFEANQYTLSKHARGVVIA